MSRASKCNRVTVRTRELRAVGIVTRDGVDGVFGEVGAETEYRDERARRVPLVIASTEAAFAATPASGGTAESAPQLSESLSELHAVGQWSVTLSEMAEKRAKSDLVKNYAHTITNANPTLDAKLASVATKKGIDIATACAPLLRSPALSRIADESSGPRSPCTDSLSLVGLDRVLANDTRG